MLIKSFLLQFSLWLAIILGLFSSTVYAQSIRKKGAFDNGWKFHLGNAAIPKKDFKYGAVSNTPVSKRFKDFGWQQVTVPHDWVVALAFE